MTKQPIKTREQPFNLISVDKKNSFKALKSFISAFDFDWLFSRPIKLSVSFKDVHSYTTESGSFLLRSDNFPREVSDKKLQDEHSTIGNISIKA